MRLRQASACLPGPTRPPRGPPSCPFMPRAKRQQRNCTSLDCTNTDQCAALPEPTRCLSSWASAPLIQIAAPPLCLHLIFWFSAECADQFIFIPSLQRSLSCDRLLVGTRQKSAQESNARNDLHLPVPRPLRPLSHPHSTSPVAEEENWRALCPACTACRSERAGAPAVPPHGSSNSRAAIAGPCSGRITKSACC